MRYKEFYESDDSDKETRIRLYENIWERSQPCLKELKFDVIKNIMYRGITPPKNEPGNLVDYYGIKTARLTDRTPNDTILEYHNDLNKYFRKYYGHPFRNGVFVTGSHNVGAGYGSLRAIFPIGNFDYIWHSNIEDLFSDVLETNGPAINEWYKLYEEQTGNSVEENEEDFEKWLENASAADVVDSLGPYNHNQFLTSALQGRNEVMIWTEQYYFLDPDHLTEFQSWINKRLKK